MRRITDSFILLACVALLFALVFPPRLTAQSAVPQAAPKMTVWQARRILTESVQHARNFTGTTFDYDWRAGSKKPVETFSFNLRDAPEVALECSKSHSWCNLKYQHEVKYPPAQMHLLETIFANPGMEYKLMEECDDACKARSATWVEAFSILRIRAIQYDDLVRDYKVRAAAWRALQQKPTIPDDARVKALLAEDALKDNKPDRALAYYEAGLEIYQTWPEAHFNAALVAASLNDYGEAIEHMQAYLELVPDAADAQAAKEKVLLWKAKAAEQ